MVTLIEKDSIEELESQFDTLEQAKSALFKAVKCAAIIDGHEDEIKQEIDKLKVGDEFCPQDWDAGCDTVYKIL